MTKQVQEEKARLSEGLGDASHGDPDENRRLTRAAPSFVDHLLDGPKVDHLVTDRARDLPRAIDL